MQLRLVKHAASELRKRSNGSGLLVYDELPASATAIRMRGGYFVGDELWSVGRPPDKLRIRPAQIVAVR